MLTDLKLLPGPRLTYRAYPMPATEEVTACAEMFLFENVDIDPAVTVGDVFALLRTSPLLLTLYHRHFAAALLAEAEKGVLASPTHSPLDYVRLYQHWQYASRAKTFESQRLGVDGVSPVLTEDHEDGHAKAGERIHWSLSMTSVRELLSVPVRLDPLVRFKEADLNAKAYGSTVDRVTQAHITLGELLDALLSELSFHGAPEERDETLEALKAQVAELDAARDNPDAAPVQYTDAADLFAEWDAPALADLFESQGAAPGRISLVLRGIEDDANAADALEAALPGVRVRERYRTLNGYDFREAFSEERTQARLRKLGA